jgi:hypothetical protein
VELNAKYINLCDFPTRTIGAFKPRRGLSRVAVKVDLRASSLLALRRDL